MRSLDAGALVVVVFLASAVIGCDETPIKPSGQPQVLAPPAPPSPPAPIPPAPPRGPGNFTVSLVAESGCDNLPEEATKRTWPADITPGDGGAQVVALVGGRFLGGLVCTLDGTLDCNQFVLRPGADTVEIDIETDNDSHGGQIVEQVSGERWIEVQAKGIAPLTSVIDTYIGGSIWFCPTASGYPFPCSTYTYCKSDRLRLTIAPKSQ